MLFCCFLLSEVKKSNSLLSCFLNSLADQAVVFPLVTFLYLRTAAPPSTETKSVTVLPHTSRLIGVQQLFDANITPWGVKPVNKEEKSVIKALLSRARGLHDRQVFQITEFSGEGA